LKRVKIAVVVTIAFCVPLSASAGYVAYSMQDIADSMQATRDQQRAEAEAAGRARNAEAAAARANEEAVKNSPAGHIQGAEQQIRYCTARISQARDALKQEDQIAQVSGVQDLALRHDAGAAIITCREQIESAWREYKQYGGAAPSSDALVKRLIAGTP
jgi:hypothetical protein